MTRIIAATAFVALLSACSDSTGPDAPAAVAATSSIMQTATVGLPATQSPAVRVVDADGDGVANVSVRFEVTAGGGSVAQTQVVTDASGMASAGTWTLGTVAGENRVVATVSGLDPETFTATAIAGAVAQLEKVEGDAQFVLPSALVAVRPAVRATDSFGNVVAGVTVTFTAQQGTITDAAAVTDAQGVARVGSWRVTATGVNRLVAASGAVSVTFVPSVLNPCFEQSNLGVGGTANGTLDANDCQVAGRATQTLRITLTEPRNLLLRIGATGFAYQWILANATTGGEVLRGQAGVTTGQDYPISLPVGTYYIEVTAPAAGGTGGFSIGLIAN